MNILDENILASQRQLLKNWRIRIRQIGYDIGRKGLQDEEIVSFLHPHRRSTFFTRDLGWYERTLCHSEVQRGDEGHPSCRICVADDWRMGPWR